MSEYNRYRLKQISLNVLAVGALAVVAVTWFSRSYWLFAVSLIALAALWSMAEASRADWRYRHIRRYLDLPNDVTAAATAFAVLKSELQADSEYAWSWHCSIAMAIADESHAPGSERYINYDFCNMAAARFMRLCFDVDVTKSPQWESLFAGEKTNGKV